MGYIVLFSCVRPLSPRVLGKRDESDDFRSRDKDFSPSRFQTTLIVQIPSNDGNAYRIFIIAFRYYFPLLACDCVWNLDFGPKSPLLRDDPSLNITILWINYYYYY